jgi:hypothetical protein
MPYEIEDLFMSIGVMKDYKVKLRDLHVSHTLGCVGTGTPKDRDEVNRERGWEMGLGWVLSRLFIMNR